MKTWEMIKELTENPEKRFKRVGDNLEVSIDMDNSLLWKSGHAPFNINHVWEEVKEPVDFITAIKSGKKVRVRCAVETHKGQLLEICTRNPTDMLRTLSTYTEKQVREMILNGDWYIED